MAVIYIPAGRLDIFIQSEGQVVNICMKLASGRILLGYQRAGTGEKNNDVFFWDEPDSPTAQKTHVR